MRKLGLVLLLCLFTVLLTGRGEAREIETYVSVNSTGVIADTAVSTSTIIPGKHRILAFRVNPNSDNCLDGTAKLYDLAATTSITSSNQFDSLEAITGTYQHSKHSGWYPMPKGLSNGLCIRQGGYTDVTVFYERNIP